MTEPVIPPTTEVKPGEGTPTNTPPVVPAVPPVVETPATEPSEEGLSPEVKAILKKERDARKASDKLATENAKKIKEYEDRDKTAEQKLLEERDALKNENAALKSGQLQRDVAAEKGLAPSLSKYLVGSTREELEASADELAAATKTPKKFGEIGHGEQTPAASGRIYTDAEIRNHAFFTANKADILLAQKEGRIKD